MLNTHQTWMVEEFRDSHTISGAKNVKVWPEGDTEKRPHLSSDEHDSVWRFAEQLSFLTE